jgi:hypothetical protein
MPLQDFEAYPDYFEYDDKGHFSFPCVVCKHREKKMTEHPCSICGHNCCSEHDNS